jgi:hypothetical protein
VRPGLERAGNVVEMGEAVVSVGDALHRAQSATCSIPHVLSNMPTSCRYSLADMQLTVCSSVRRAPRRIVPPCGETRGLGGKSAWLRESGGSNGPRTIRFFNIEKGELMAVDECW